MATKSARIPSTVLITSLPGKDEEEEMMDGRDGGEANKAVAVVLKYVGVGRDRSRESAGLDTCTRSRGRRWPQLARMGGMGSMDQAGDIGPRSSWACGVAAERGQR